MYKIRRTAPRKSTYLTDRRQYISISTREIRNAKGSSVLAKI